MTGQVLNFQKMGRRKAIARLTKNYAPMLAHIMQHASLDDGEHFDDNGLPMVRGLDRTEMRHGAVANAALFLGGLISARTRLEPLPDGNADTGLFGFDFQANRRARTYHFEHMGKSKIVVLGKYRRDLQRIELNYSTAIFGALRIEATNDLGLELDEVEFWADIFRGFGDGDPSGIILRAAGLVLLDHLDAFSRAIAFHTYQGEKHALGQALKG